MRNHRCNDDMTQRPKKQRHQHLSAISVNTEGSEADTEVLRTWTILNAKSILLWTVVRLIEIAPLNTVSGKRDLGMRNCSIVCTHTPCTLPSS